MTAVVIASAKAVRCGQTVAEMMPGALRRYREAAGIPAAVVARKMGKSPQTVYKAEGSKAVSWEKLEALAAALGAELIEGKAGAWVMK